MSKKFKVLMLTATSGLILQLGGCFGNQWLRWLGDLAGDALWLRAID